MNDAIALLDRVASRKQLLRIVALNLSEGPVFALLGGLVGHDGHDHLNMRVSSSQVVLSRK